MPVIEEKELNELMKFRGVVVTQDQTITELLRASQAGRIEALADALDNAQITIHLLFHKENKKSYIGCPSCAEVRELAGVTK